MSTAIQAMTVFTTPMVAYHSRAVRRSWTEQRRVGRLWTSYLIDIVAKGIASVPSHQYGRDTSRSRIPSESTKTSSNTAQSTVWEARRDVGSSESETMLAGLGFALEGFVPTFVAVMAAQVVWGLGVAFESGSVEAWISDEVGEVRASHAFLRAAQVRHAAALAGVGAAALFGRASLGLPLVAGGVCFVLLAGFLWLSMRESPFAAAEGVRLDPWHAIAGTLRRGLELAARRPLVWTILGVAVFMGASSETFDRLWEAQMLAGPGIPSGLGAPARFALLAALTTVLGISVLEAARRTLDRLDPDGRSYRPLIGILLALALVRGAAIAGFGLAGRIDLAVAMYFVASVSQGVHVPLYRAWLNRELEPSTRATAFSAAGFSDALGQGIGGPLLGLVAATAGMPAAFVAAAVLLGPAAVLPERSRRRAPGPD